MKLQAMHLQENMAMRTTTGALIFLLLVVMLLATRQLALGQSESATVEDFITVDDKASGVKVQGILTMYYEPELTGRCRISNPAAKFFFMRVKKGKDLIPFSGDLSGEHICLADNFPQQAAIEEFVRDQVIPELFPDTPLAPFALKSVKRSVLGVRPPTFLMIDFVIAVQEK